ncbi:hypothetical protein ABK040_011305 [Willaertia magna]
MKPSSSLSEQEEKEILKNKIEEYAEQVEKDLLEIFNTESELTSLTLRLRKDNQEYKLKSFIQMKEFITFILNELILEREQDNNMEEYHSDNSSIEELDLENIDNTKNGKLKMEEIEMTEEEKKNKLQLINEMKVNNQLINNQLQEKYKQHNTDNTTKDGNTQNIEDNNPLKRKTAPTKEGNTTKENKEGNNTKDGNSKEGNLGIKRQKKTTTITIEKPTIKFEDIGGIDHILQDIRELIEYPILHPEIYQTLGVEPPRGILLYGPPGSGKTQLAHAIAGELNVTFLKISAPELVSGMSGESEMRIRNLFKDAIQLAPSIIFIDEIDVITSKRDMASKEMEKRMVAQLLTCMDNLSLDKTEGKTVIVIGATNRPDTLDSALRRAGRFDREISIGIPDEDARCQILKCLCRKLKISGGDTSNNSDTRIIIIIVIVEMAGSAILAIHRIFGDLFINNNTTTTIDNNNTINGSNLSEKDKKEKEKRDRQFISEKLRSIPKLSEEQLQYLNITMQDFENAIKKVQPSALREGFATIPNVTWDDIGALDEIREELRMSIMEPIKNPEKFTKLGLNAPLGVLLYGPPGCGKTLLAKAIANDSRANFISIKGPELLNKFVGESERAVRQVFARASASAPCVVFFDELDALCPKRDSDSSSQSSERVVNQLLTEMDGLESRKNVFVIAATNRPDMIDPAMLRPGRLDKLLYVKLPNEKERFLILKTLIRNTPITKDINLNEIAKKAIDFSGADMAALVREAATCCLKENLNAQNLDQIMVTKNHFYLAIQKVKPSVSTKDLKMYDRIANGLRTSRNHIVMDKEDGSSSTTSSSGNATTGLSSSGSTLMDTTNDNVNTMSENKIVVKGSGSGKMKK